MHHSTIDTIEKFTLDIKKRDKVVKMLEIDNREMHDITAKQADSIEALEGYTRVDNLLVYGLPETYAEVGLASSGLDGGLGSISTESSSQSEATFLQFCEMILKVKIDKQHIYICHRLRRSSPTDTSARPMIVRFSNRRARSEVLATKANLKNSHLRQ